MMASRKRLAALVLAALPLAGCHSIFGIHFARQGAPDYTKLVRIDGPATPPAAGTATAEGRAHLAAGEPGLAVEAFQRALGLGEPIAPAANGMGVGYAEMGRYDLARRFFEQALSADPGSEKYAANLARMADAERLAAAAALPVAASAAEPSADGAAPALADQPRVRAASALAAAAPLQRISPREVRVAVAPLPSLPPARVLQRRANVVALHTGGSGPVSSEELQRFRPVIRIVFGSADNKPVASAPSLMAQVQSMIRFSFEHGATLKSGRMASLAR